MPWLRLPDVEIMKRAMIYSALLALFSVNQIEIGSLLDAMKPEWCQKHAEPALRAKSSAFHSA